MNKGKLQQFLESIQRIARQHGALRLRVFGSVARDEATAESDLDLLADFEPRRDLMAMAGLKVDLEGTARLQGGCRGGGRSQPLLARARLAGSAAAMKEARVYRLHIREALGRIESYTTGGREGFMRQTLIQDAVIRDIEILGEAVKKLPREFRDQHPPCALVPDRRDAGRADPRLFRGEPGAGVAEADLSLEGKECAALRWELTFPRVIWFFC